VKTEGKKYTKWFVPKQYKPKLKNVSRGDAENAEQTRIKNINALRLNRKSFVFDFLSVLHVSP
jgi:hypothetical protein